MRILTPILLVLSFIYSQEESYNYWNSLATHVTVAIPLANDNSLVGGRVQVKVSVDNGRNYLDLGEQFSNPSVISTLQVEHFPVPPQALK